MDPCGLKQINWIELNWITLTVSTWPPRPTRTLACMQYFANQTSQCSGKNLWNWELRNSRQRFSWAWNRCPPHSNPLLHGLDPLAVHTCKVALFWSNFEKYASHSGFEISEKSNTDCLSESPLSYGCESGNLRWKISGNLYWKFPTSTNLPNNCIFAYIFTISAFIAPEASSSALIVTLKHCFRD